MQNTKIVRTALLAIVALWAIPAAAQCGPEQYFGAADANNDRPLAIPAPELRKTQRLAAGGDAVEARNLGAFYDIGYLVTPCREKALQWYRRAAESGDEPAKEWLERHSALERLRTGPECYSDTCFSGAGGGVQKTVLRTGPNGHYKTAVRINGKAVQGMIDTGASYVSMSAKMAQELGLSYANGRQFHTETANGRAERRAVMLDSVTIGNITLKNVEGAVGDADHQLLIGMSFLKRLTISTGGGAMTLAHP